MTGIVVIRKTNAVELLTDKAAFGKGGRVEYFARKTARLRCHAVLAWRGPAMFGALLGQQIDSHRGSFDDVRSHIVLDAKRVLREHGDTDALKDSPYGTEFEIFAAGILSNGKPAAFCVSSEGGPGVPPWTVLEIQSVAVGPMTPEIQQELYTTFKPIPPDAPADEFDAERDGVTVMEILRKHPIAHGADRFVCVGGAVDLTTITADAITTRTIHRWPDDKVGKPIVAPREIWRTIVEPNPIAGGPPITVGRIRRGSFAS